MQNIHCFEAAQVFTCDDPEYDPLHLIIDAAAVNPSIVLLHVLDVQVVLPPFKLGMGALNPFGPVHYPDGATVLQAIFFLSPDSAEVEHITIQCHSHIDASCCIEIHRFDSRQGGKH